MEQLILWGSLPKEAADFLKILVRAKYNIFVSGGTGAGKTTFLNVLSDFIPKEERIITIEDNAELQIHGVPNLVRLESEKCKSGRRRRGYDPGFDPVCAENASGPDHCRRSSRRRDSRYDFFRDAERT